MMQVIMGKPRRTAEILSLEASKNRPDIQAAEFQFGDKYVKAFLHVSAEAAHHDDTYDEDCEIGVGGVAVSIVNQGRDDVTVHASLEPTGSKFSGAWKVVRHSESESMEYFEEKLWGALSKNLTPKTIWQSFKESFAGTEISSGDSCALICGRLVHSNEPSEDADNVEVKLRAMAIRSTVGDHVQTSEEIRARQKAVNRKNGQRRPFTVVRDTDAMLRASASTRLPVSKDLFVPAAAKKND